VDVRIIAATNKILKEAVAKNEFREDLFYRLNVVPLFIPPLRERREDILPLALDIMQRYNRDLKKNFTGFTPAAAELLKQYPWPGNIRELKNVIERTMILAPEGDIDGQSLPEEIREYEPEEAIAAAAAAGFSQFDIGPGGSQFVTLRELEQRYVHEVLAATGNNKTATSRILGIHTTSLMRRLKREDLDVSVRTWVAGCPTFARFWVTWGKFSLILAAFQITNRKSQIVNKKSRCAAAAAIRSPIQRDNRSFLLPLPLTQ
jgi:transcriptional regulator with PAS, ATPase and Fis domain